VPRHQETRFLPFTAEQMFALVADIERYPQFLPWVQALRIKSRDGNVVTADMVVGFKMVRERFTSRVTLEAPQRIVVNYLSGPLKYLQNDWTFRDVKGGCEIDFLVDFEFQNRMFERLAGMFFGEALRRMVGAFEARAQALYGAGESGNNSSSATIVA
jgi:coenzyme Q-binding protein COQ10